MGLGGEQGGLAPSPQLGEVMLGAWEGLGGVGGSAPPSAAGEQKDGTRRGQAGPYLCPKYGLSLARVCLRGCTHLTPSAGHDPPTPTHPPPGAVGYFYHLHARKKPRHHHSKEDRRHPARGPAHGCPWRAAPPLGAGGPRLRFLQLLFSQLCPTGLVPPTQAIFPHRGPRGGRARLRCRVPGSHLSWWRGQGVRAPARRVGKEGRRSLPSGPPHSSAVAMALPRGCQEGGGGGGGLCVSPPGLPPGGEVSPAWKARVPCSIIRIHWGERLI